MTRLVPLTLVTLAAWLAAQCLLVLWHGATPLAPDAPVTRINVPGLLSAHWGEHSVPVEPGIVLTRLPLTWIGGLKAEPLAASVVVLRCREQQHTLTRGQRLAPGVVLRQIDESGLIFENNGRLERLPWPAERPLQGLKGNG